MKSRCSLLFAIVFLFSMTRAAFATRRALLIQVGHYQDRTVPKILGPDEPESDVPLLKAIIEAPKYGFKSTTMEDDQASKQDIRKALESLANETGPDDAVLVYFSGHGARDGKSFSICPWDAFRDSATNDITEEHLRDWIRSLKTNNVTLILDCCFSSVPARGARSAPKHPKFMGRDPGGEMLANIPIDLPRDKTVLLTAADQNQVAMQVKIDEKWYGPFTYFLCTQLKAAPPNTTYSQLIENVRQDVSFWATKSGVQRSYVQTPTMVASRELANRPLFTAVSAKPVQVDLKPVKPYVLVDHVDGGKVYLNAGSDLNVIVDAEYAVYPKGETQFSGRPLATLKVDAAKPTQAIASVVGGDASKISSQCRATITRYPKKIVSADVLVARVDGPDDIAAPFQSALSRIKGFQFAKEGGPEPQVVLRMQRDGAGLKCFVNASDGATAVDDDNPSYNGKTPEEVAGKVTRALNLYAALHALVTMHNPNPAFRLTIEAGKPQYVAGDKAEFTLKADQDCYFFLIDIDPLGVPTLIFPTPANKDNSLRSNQDRKFPGFPVNPPTGKETLLALATRNEAQAKALTAVLLNDPPAQPEPTGSRRVGRQHQEKIEDIQKLPLADWAIAIRDIQTLSKEVTSGLVKPAARGINRATAVRSARRNSRAYTR